MGCCASRKPEDVEARDLDNKIAQELQQDKVEYNDKLKILLLGAGSSGKSTLLKQMNYLFAVDKGFDDKDIEHYEHVLFWNLLEVINVLCKKYVELYHISIDKSLKNHKNNNSINSNVTPIVNEIKESFNDEESKEQQKEYLAEKETMSQEYNLNDENDSTIDLIIQKPTKRKSLSDNTTENSHKNMLSKSIRNSNNINSNDEIEEEILNSDELSDSDSINSIDVDFTLNPLLDNNISKFLELGTTIHFQKRNEYKHYNELNEIIKNIWSIKNIKYIFNNKYKYKLNLMNLIDNSKYMIDNMERILNKKFKPSIIDICHSRKKTSGIVLSKFSREINNNKNSNKNKVYNYEIVDVGGQRTERRKWIHCFNNVNAVIFVIALSGYNQVLFEDNRINKLDEAIELFENTITKPCFKEKGFIIFLNKHDLFKKKIKKIPFNCKNYTGDIYNREQVIKFIKNILEKRNKNNNKLYFHITTAVDTDLVQNTFNKVERIVIGKSLENLGMM